MVWCPFHRSRHHDNRRYYFLIQLYHVCHDVFNDAFYDFCYGNDECRKRETYFGSTGGTAGTSQLRPAGGKDVREYDMEVLRNEVSVVLQKNVLFSGTILDNLRWGKEDATVEECKEACRAACADEFIDRLPDGYDTWIERGGTNVSGGQKQRLCIARALLKNPKILILDDSTRAVDTATDAKIRKAFREVIPGTTKIIIAQRVSSVQDADRILVLENGSVNGFDTHEHLFETNDIYRSIYESQMQGGGDFDQAD